MICHGVIWNGLLLIKCDKIRCDKIEHDRIKCDEVKHDRIKCDIMDESLGLPTVYGPLQSLHTPQSLLSVRQTRIQKTMRIFCIVFD